MNGTSISRTVAVIGAVVITSTTASAGVTAAASTGADQRERPCFMFRAHWNNAEGPQPTCPVSIRS